MSALAALLRVERRAFLRAPWCSALFVALVATPCAALVAAAALQRTVLPTDEQARVARFGERAFAVVAESRAALAGFAGAALLDAPAELTTLASGEHVVRFDADAVRGTELAAHARRRGLTLERRLDAAADTSFETLVLHVVGVFGFAVAALVVGAAVAVGLRRRSLEFARLAACGAPATSVGAALAIATGVTALCAALVGVGLGILGAFALLPLLAAWTERDLGALTIAWDVVLAAPLLGVFAALAAAAPSIVRVVRNVRDVHVDRAREPRPHAPRRALLGVALFATGVAVVLSAPSGDAGALASVATGSLIGLVGLACTVGASVDLSARLSAGAPLAWRIALRDAARSSGRSGAAALAVLAGLASATTIASLGEAVQHVARANGNSSAERDPLLAFALIAACVLGLGVVAVASALDAAEGARDTDVLVANGAEPRTLLAVNGARAAHLAVVGGLLSVPAGLLPAFGLVRVADVPLTFALPWREITVALLVLPALAFLVGSVVGALVGRFGNHTT